MRLALLAIRLDIARSVHRIIAYGNNGDCIEVSARTL